MEVHSILVGEQITTPLEGCKFSDWQGGVCVNAFVSGGYLPEKMRGQKTEQCIYIADWFATICYLANINPTDERAAKANLPPVDSLSMWPLISGQNSTSPCVDISISKMTLISGPYMQDSDRKGSSSQLDWTSLAKHFTSSRYCS